MLKENSELLEKHRRGYALICNKQLVGVFRSYEEAAEKSREACRVHALIIELPYRGETVEVELGLPL